MNTRSGQRKASSFMNTCLTRQRSRAILGCLLLVSACQTRADAPRGSSEVPSVLSPVRSSLPLFAGPRHESIALGSSSYTPNLAPSDVALSNVTAPAEIHLTQTGPLETMDLLLDFRISRDAPDVKARFVVPPEVEVLQGELERDFGPLSAGQGGKLQLEVRVPSTGSYVLAAGVDLQISSGVRLHKSAAVKVGNP